MSPIIINSTPTTNNIPKNNSSDDPEKAEEEDPDKAREERKATGRSIAIIIFLSLMCLALYHVIQRKTTILAGVLVPALILFAYTFFVIHISNRDKKRRKKLASELELPSHSDIKNSEPTKISTTPSATTIPSTSSGKQSKSTTKSTPQTKSTINVKSDQTSKIARSQNDNKTNAAITSAKKVPPPFKKTPSQSHIQVKSSQSAAHMSVENEVKKLKKSRSFDRNNHSETRHIAIDSKKMKTKH